MTAGMPTTARDALVYGATQSACLFAAAGEPAAMTLTDEQLARVLTAAFAAGQVAGITLANQIMGVA